MISSATMAVSAPLRRRDVPAKPGVAGQGRVWRGSGGADDVRPEYGRGCYLRY